MRRLLLTATLSSFALVTGVASASGTQPTGQIAFGKNRFCLAGGGNGGGKAPVDCGKGEIAVVDADGSHLRILTHDKVTETSPAWSPNREQIAFIRPKPHTSDQVWVMNADGTGQHALTHFRNAPQLFGNDETPDLSWSPDGQELVFAAFANTNGGLEQLYVVDVRTHHVRRLTRLSTGATEPVWSPNGRWIAFVGAVAPDRIYLLSTKTRRAHVVGSATGLGVAWSPDSKRLAFNSKGTLWLVNALGPTRFHSLRVRGEQPSWSPDGQWIVFTAGPYLTEIRPDGKGIHHILHVGSKQGWNFEPDW
jgi:Tol biopolymer transport system component